MLRGHTNWVNAVIWLEEWGWVGSAGGDNKILLHDPVSRKIASKLAGHFAPIHCLQFIRDGLNPMNPLCPTQPLPEPIAPPYAPPAPSAALLCSISAAAAVLGL